MDELIDIRQKIDGKIFRYILVESKLCTIRLINLYAKWTNIKKLKLYLLLIISARLDEATNSNPLKHSNTTETLESRIVRKRRLEKSIKIDLYTKESGISKNFNDASLEGNN